MMADYLDKRFKDVEARLGRLPPTIEEVVELEEFIAGRWRTLIMEYFFSPL